VAAFAGRRRSSAACSEARSTRIARAGDREGAGRLRRDPGRRWRRSRRSGGIRKTTEEAAKIAKRRLSWVLMNSAVTISTAVETMPVRTLRLCLAFAPPRYAIDHHSTQENYG
jgi:hypothetical protein